MPLLSYSSERHSFAEIQRLLTQRARESDLVAAETSARGVHAHQLAPTLPARLLIELSARADKLRLSVTIEQETARHTRAESTSEHRTKQTSYDWIGANDLRGYQIYLVL